MHLPPSVIDLTGTHALSRLLALHELRGDGWGFPTHLWRCVALAPRNASVSPSVQALGIAAKHWATHDLMLFRTAFPELTPIAADAWRALSANALSQGLAYPGESLPAIDAFVGELLAFLPGAELRSNHSGRGDWEPLTSHTFDACFIASNAALLAVVLVVDED